MKLDRDTQRRLVGVVRRLDEVLALLDASDLGDCESAALIERAVQRAKGELRRDFGLEATLLPVPTLRRGAKGSALFRGRRA